MPIRLRHRRHRGRIEAPAIIGDPHGHVGLAVAQGHGRVPRTGVLGHVAERLADDADDRALAIGLELVLGPEPLHVHRKSALPLHVVDEARHRCR